MLCLNSGQIFVVYFFLNNRKSNSHRVDHVIDDYEIAETKQRFCLTFCLTIEGHNSEVSWKPTSNARCRLIFFVSIVLDDFK